MRAEDPGAPDLAERLRALPKPELHVHLDGSLRPQTLIELAVARGVALPTRDAGRLAEHMVAPPARTLEAYLTRFDLTLGVMQDAEALERITFELCEDHAAEHVRYVEVRFCPDLNTRGGLTPDQVLDAVLRGLHRAEAAHDLRGALIVCALRDRPAEHSTAMAELAAAYRERGVCGFDLAGAEHGHPVSRHRRAFEIATSHAVPVTIHAGEAFGPESIRQALDLGHAMRIGHGTRLGEDPDLLARVADAGVTLEVCLTSNVQTGAVPAIEAHPARRYHDAGVSISLSTDNRLVSGVALTDEYLAAATRLGFSLEELISIARNGFARAFQPPEVRAALVGAFDESVRA